MFYDYACQLFIMSSIFLDAAKKLIAKKENMRSSIMSMLQLAPEKRNKEQLKRLLALQPQKR